MTTNLVNIVDQLSDLKIVEVAQLVKMLEEKWGVSAAAVAVAQPVANNVAQAAAEGPKTSCNVVLASAGGNKIAVIKAIRELMPNLNLAEAKKLADEAPKTLKENATMDDANAMKKKLEESGATVELK